MYYVQTTEYRPQGSVARDFIPGCDLLKRNAT